MISVWTSGLCSSCRLQTLCWQLKVLLVLPWRLLPLLPRQQSRRRPQQQRQLWRAGAQGPARHLCACGHTALHRLAGGQASCSGCGTRLHCMACSETGSSAPQSGTKPWQQQSETLRLMLPRLVLLLLLAEAVRVTGRLRLSLVLVLLVLASLVWQPLAQQMRLRLRRRLSRCH